MYYIPDATQAVEYNEIANQSEIERSAANYVAKVYGLDIAMAFPIAATIIVRHILAGATEAMAQESLLAGFGLKTI